MAKTNEDTISPVKEQAPQNKVDNISNETDTPTETLQAPPHAFQAVNNSNSTSFLPLTEAESRIFILSNDKRKGTVSLDVEEDVIDPDRVKKDPITGKPDYSTAVRRMRLLRGAQSIWFDEQPPTVFPQSYVNKNVLTLDFNRGKCIIPINQPLMIKAAELTMRNTANKEKYGAKARAKDIYFYEWNPAVLNAKAIAEENDVIKAMQLAMTTPLAEMIPHASYLNIQFQDEQGVPLNEEALRTAYIKYAKNNADKFLKSVHSPTVKVAHLVRKAITDGKIDLGKQAGAAYWVDGGFISTLPQGRDAVEYLIEFAMTHGEGNIAFANQLRTLSS